MQQETKRILYQIALFIATFITTTFAGVEWAYGKSVYAISDTGSVILNPFFTWQDFVKGLEFSIPLLLILTVHEFGHYFTAMYHRVKTSLPYYIPIPPIPLLPFSIGTMGAVIRLRSRPETNLKNFDIGLAGPLAGFIVALMVMFYGFKTLPPAEHIYQFHPEYEEYGPNYAAYVYTEEYARSQNQLAIDITIGKNLIFFLFEKFADDPSRVPNAHELMHYPVLLAAYIALFFTCLNLLPIGQLDGGHVVYGLFGYKTHKRIAMAFFIALMFYAGLGLPYIDPQLPLLWLAVGIAGYLAFLYFAFSGLHLPPRATVVCVLLVFCAQFLLMSFFPGIRGYQGWLLFGFLLGRFIGVQYPPADIEKPLDTRRVILGWLTLIIFILCFSPAPIELQEMFNE